MKNTIDLADGARILGKDEASAQSLLEYLIDTFTEVRRELNDAYGEYQSDRDAMRFSFAVEKFYDGLLYVGAPALRQSVYDLLMALYKEEHAISHLYQHALDEMDALEQKISEMKMTGGA